MNFSATTTPVKTARPRIRYLDPLASPRGDLLGLIDRAAGLGFDAVLVPPPWLPGADGDRFTPRSAAQMNPALGDGFLNDFTSACQAAGVVPMLDLPLAALDAGFEGDTVPYAAAVRHDPLDPRQGVPVVPRQVADEDAAAAWWVGVARDLAGAGIGGVRLVGADAVPSLGRQLRDALPELCTIAWTPGLARAVLPALAGCSFVVSSLAWWDMEGDWFWAELSALAEVAPILACPEAPFGARATAEIHDPARLTATLRRLAAVSAATADGWIVPEGFETAARRRLDPRGRTPMAGDRQVDTKLDLRACNEAFAATPAATRGTEILSGGGEATLAIVRADAADTRFAQSLRLDVVNTDLTAAATTTGAALLSRLGGGAAAWNPALSPDSALSLAPGERVSFTATRGDRRPRPAAFDRAAAKRAADGPRVAIENPTPCVDDGSFPVKRIAGDSVTVEVDVIGDGHEKFGVALRWSGPAGSGETRMAPCGNDRYRAEMPLPVLGAYEYVIQAWRDAFATYRDEIAKKSAAGVDVGLELREGLLLLERTVQHAQGPVRNGLRTALDAATGEDDAAKLARFLSPEFAALMAEADDRPRAATLPRPVRVDAERPGAGFAAWYEVFPRSMSDDPARHGTFRDVERHLPRVRAMGFDVLYFPPVSPIGRTNRKGPNNTLTPAEGDPGSPYAVGSAEGGHDALHPELGTAEDFRHLVKEAATHGLEIAIDFAIQCSPDHPWLKQHREWFDWRPDGSIKYAENPPKKYQDIVNVDFYANNAAPGLWVALADVVMFWMELGVRLVRVDNPHTKPLPFWQWMIASVRERYPDAVFLAEAFTRPKLMYRLAKVGFSQSYSYFTWRETKRDMEQYLTELAEPGPREFFRPHFFVNTPDINPVYLQGAPRSAYLIRAALAATLSGLWGVYNGFELCEGTPMPGREEYLDSEKYQVRAWDWDRPGNIVPEITELNRIRRFNPALRSHLTTTFLPAGNDVLSVYLRATPDRGNALVVAVSYEPNQAQETGFEFPFWLWGVTETTAFEVEDLLSGARLTWAGKYQSVRVGPDRPYVIWRVRVAS